MGSVTPEKENKNTFEARKKNEISTSRKKILNNFLNRNTEYSKFLK